MQISLTDESGQTRFALTGSFGYYRFTDLPAGATYFVQARAKRFTFTSPTHVVNLNEDVEGYDFTAEQ